MLRDSVYLKEVIIMNKNNYLFDSEERDNEVKKILGDDNFSYFRDNIKSIIKMPNSDAAFVVQCLNKQFSYEYAIKNEKLMQSLKKFLTEERSKSSGEKSVSQKPHNVSNYLFGSEERDNEIKDKIGEDNFAYVRDNYDSLINNDYKIESIDAQITDVNIDQSKLKHTNNLSSAIPNNNISEFDLTNQNEVKINIDNNTEPINVQITDNGQPNLNLNHSENLSATIPGSNISALDSIIQKQTPEVNLNQEVDAQKLFNLLNVDPEPDHGIQMSPSDDNIDLRDEIVHIHTSIDSHPNLTDLTIEEGNIEHPNLSQTGNFSTTVPDNNNIITDLKNNESNFFDENTTPVASDGLCWAHSMVAQLKGTPEYNNLLIEANRDPDFQQESSWYLPELKTYSDKIPNDANDVKLAFYLRKKGIQALEKLKVNTVELKKSKTSAASPEEFALIHASIFQKPATFVCEASDNNLPYVIMVDYDKANNKPILNYIVANEDAKSFLELPNGITANIQTINEIDSEKLMNDLKTGPIFNFNGINHFQPAIHNQNNDYDYMKFLNHINEYLHKNDDISTNQILETQIEHDTQQFSPQPDSTTTNNTQANQTFNFNSTNVSDETYPDETQQVISSLINNINSISQELYSIRTDSITTLDDKKNALDKLNYLRSSLYDLSIELVSAEVFINSNLYSDLKQNSQELVDKFHEKANSVLDTIILNNEQKAKLSDFENLIQARNPLTQNDITEINSQPLEKKINHYLEWSKYNEQINNLIMTQVYNVDASFYLHRFNEFESINLGPLKINNNNLTFDESSEIAKANDKLMTMCKTKLGSLNLHLLNKIQISDQEILQKKDDIITDKKNLDNSLDHGQISFKTASRSLESQKNVLDTLIEYCINKKLSHIDISQLVDLSNSLCDSINELSLAEKYSNRINHIQRCYNTTSFKQKGFNDIIKDLNAMYADINKLKNEIKVESNLKYKTILLSNIDKMQTNITDQVKNQIHKQLKLSLKGAIEDTTSIGEIKKAFFITPERDKLINKVLNSIESDVNNLMSLSQPKLDFYNFLYYGAINDINDVFDRAKYVDPKLQENTLYILAANHGDLSDINLGDQSYNFTDLYMDYMVNSKDTLETKSKVNDFILDNKNDKDKMIFMRDYLLFNSPDKNVQKNLSKIQGTKTEKELLTDKNKSLEDKYTTGKKLSSKWNRDKFLHKSNEIYTRASGNQVQAKNLDELEDSKNLVSLLSTITEKGLRDNFLGMLQNKGFEVNMATGHITRGNRTLSEIIDITKAYIQENALETNSKLPVEVEFAKPSELIEQAMQAKDPNVAMKALTDICKKYTLSKTTIKEINEFAIQKADVNSKTLLNDLLHAIGEAWKTNDTKENNNQPDNNKSNHKHIIPKNSSLPLTRVANNEDRSQKQKSKPFDVTKSIPTTKAAQKNNMKKCLNKMM